MSRIRSVHPGLFTDETFVALSDAAQIFYVGLWTEADDQGIFEWKPLTLKMRLRPCSNSPVDPLLEELLSGNAIRQFSIAGRTYGAIRNFRLYQKPKYPNTVHPITPEIRKYVCLDGKISGIDGVEESEFPQKEENVSLMEDGESSEVRTPLPPAGGFDEFWKLYPHKVGEASARKALADALAKSALGEILAGLRRYIAAKPQTVAWKNPAGWLNAERWKDRPANPGAKPITLVHSGPKRTFAEIKEAEARAKHGADPPSGLRPISSIAPTVLLPVEGTVS